MTRALGIISLLLALSAQSAQTAKTQRLLGSSFGVPQDAAFDYVVVGGGTAGLVLAARLSEDPSNSVAVIEAGSFYEIGNGNLSQVPGSDVYYSGKSPDDVNPLIDWGFVTQPGKGIYDVKAHYPRGKTLGGCSARNFMAFHRGTKGSYKMWADKVGDDSYTFEEFLPFFEKSIDFTPTDVSKRASNNTPEYDISTLGKGGGPVSVTFSNYGQPWSTWVQKGLAAIGINPINGFTSGSLIGSSYVLESVQATTQTRESSETAYLQPALSRSNLIVYHSTLAKKILFDNDNVATGVAVDTAGKTYTLSAKKEVLLSAGAFQSPQLLMVSGIGPAKTLKKHQIPVIADRPGVGQNMWDHVFYGVTYRVNVVTSSSMGNPLFAEEAVKQYLTEQNGILTNTGGEFLAYEKLPRQSRKALPRSALRDLNTFPRDWPEIEYLTLASYLGAQDNYITGQPRDAYQYASLAAALVAPLSRGTVDISSNDTADPPLIDPAWLTHPTDQAVAIASYKRLREFFNTDALQDVLIGPEYFPGEEKVQTDAEILDIVKKSFNTVYHAASTCAMGRKGDPQAVVDSKGKVFGVKGLRVVDASAFPFLVPGHPQATVYALAEKIADEIRAGK
ncbi:MAG: hypothetical protein M4579_006096 [Chaenotheca gracillima]|nr:MAG: hypothetical protein M4579_006096 [Chaenotheca gracillima]